MALKGTDRVTSKRLVTGDVVLTSRTPSASDRVTPVETLAEGAWRTVAAPATSEVQYAAHSVKAHRFYAVSFTDGTRSDGLAPSQHWTRKVEPGAALARAAEIVQELGGTVTVDTVSADKLAAMRDAGRLEIHTVAPARADHEPYTADVDDLATDGERCGTCKGLGLVRGVGSRAGRPYRTLAGAQAAYLAERAHDCPTCHGVGLELPARELVNA